MKKIISKFVFTVKMVQLNGNMLIVIHWLFDGLIALQKFIVLEHNIFHKVQCIIHEYQLVIQKVISKHLLIFIVILHEQFVQKRMVKNNSSEQWEDFPGVKEGIRGMAFIESCVANSKNNNEKWTELKE